MANKKFLVGILAMVLVFGMAVVGCALDGDSNTPQDLTILNNTGGPINGIFLKAPGTLLWGTNFTQWLTSNNGSSRVITVPNDRLDSQGRVDIQLRTSNGNTFTKLSQASRGTVTFTINDLDSDSPRTVTIGNITGDAINGIFIRAPGTLLWGDNFTQWLTINSGSSRTVTVPSDRMDSQHRADIQLRTSNGNTFTRLSQTITHNSTIEFISNDLDSDSPRTITIGNVTGVAINGIFIRMPGTSDWGTNFTQWLTINSGSSRTVTVPRDRMDSQHMADIQLRTSGGDTFTRLSQTITHNGTITFTASDSP